METFGGAERPVDARFAPTGAERRLVTKEPVYAAGTGRDVTYSSIFPNPAKYPDALLLQTCYDVAINFSSEWKNDGHDFQSYESGCVI